MIFPIFLGLPTYRQIMTWLIVLLNVVFYIQFSSQQDVYSNYISQLYENKSYIQTQGILFAQIIDRNPKEMNLTLEKISAEALKGDFKSQSTLGQLAFRNPIFKKYAESFKFQGDQVQYEFWKEQYFKLVSIQKQDPTFWMGVSSLSYSWKSWISYQFLHGGFFHLLSNMWFLLLFGYFLERYIGSLWFLLLYVSSGVFAAIVFQSLSGLTIAPLIGASGSISGIMGFVLTLYWNKKMNCFYWILPTQGYHGFKKIPSKIFFVMWFISDLAGYLSTMEEFGGVAHAAHVGGFLFGITTACFYLLVKKTKQTLLEVDA